MKRFPKGTGGRDRVHELPERIFSLRFRSSWHHSPTPHPAPTGCRRPACATSTEMPKPDLIDSIMILLQRIEAHERQNQQHITFARWPDENHRRISVRIACEADLLEHREIRKSIREGHCTGRKFPMRSSMGIRLLVPLREFPDAGSPRNHLLVCTCPFRLAQGRAADAYASAETGCTAH